MTVNNDHPTIRVVFRVWRDDGTVLALFPEEVHNGHLCVCYAHVGQHGGADYNGCLRLTRPAKPEEYAPLARELESIGYHLHISQRRYYKLGKRRSARDWSFLDERKMR